MVGHPTSRFQPCYILHDNDVNSVIWCEDAIAYHGVPTAVGSFYILVPDVDRAAKVLMQQGWHLEDSTQSMFGNYPLRRAHQRLTPPVDATKDEPDVLRGTAQLLPPSKLPPGPTTTILLPASEWNYAIPSVIDTFFPPLAELLDAYIVKLLDDPRIDKIWSQLLLHLAYLYGHVPILKERSFAERLRYEHRQFHRDCLSDMTTFTLPFVRHEGKIRDALRAGSFQLCECSGDREDELLFNGKVQARLRASRHDETLLDDYETAKKRELEHELAGTNL